MKELKAVAGLDSKEFLRSLLLTLFNLALLRLELEAGAVMVDCYSRYTALRTDTVLFGQKM